MTKYTLYFDGAAKGNPGIAGAGAAIFNEAGLEVWSGSRFVGARGTNNEAEYWGLIMGLRYIRDVGSAELTVRGDSMLVIRQMRGEWNCKAPRLIPLMNEAKSLVSEIGNVRWEHVQRNDNARADALANIGCQSPPDDEVVN